MACARPVAVPSPPVDRRLRMRASATVLAGGLAGLMAGVACMAWAPMVGRGLGAGIASSAPAPEADGRSRGRAAAAVAMVLAPVTGGAVARAPAARMEDRQP